MGNSFYYPAGPDVMDSVDRVDSVDGREGWHPRNSQFVIDAALILG